MRGIPTMKSGCLTCSAPISGLALAVLLQPETIGEEADDVLPGDDAPDEGEASLVFEALKHHPERLPKILFAKVLQSRATSGGGQQVLLSE